ncbi:MAG: UvrB/UvrC motif-containing protein [Kiritimatiellia bacterium]|nr:UvrB/UvrC motif-containing protein [Kiritimatiellia bacterium]
MLCKICGKKEATVHLTQMLNDEVRKMHLCEQCAEASGIDMDAPTSVTNFLLGLGAPKNSAPGTAGRTCPQCRMRFADFKKASRLGCQNCYVTFAEELEPLLNGMQKGARHMGKKPVHYASAVNVFPSPASLKKALEEAVASENYEEAARLRDQIRAAETLPQVDSPPRSTPAKQGPPAIRRSGGDESG